MLQLAATTGGIVWAGRLDAIRRGFQHFYEARPIVASRLLKDLDSDTFTRDAAGHKDSLAIDTADRLSAVGQTVEL